VKFGGATLVFRLVCCGLLLGTPLCAQESAAKAKAEPLELKLRALHTTLCVGAGLVLELEVKNTRRAAVQIDKVDLWSNFSYGFSGADGSGRGGGMGTGCDHCRGDVIVLYPGMTYWDTHTFPLAGSFFADAGKYTFATSINSDTSNRVEFELLDCGKN
jgi:hypothetical protein